jgi:Xaa-Pro aminopeptidase
MDINMETFFSPDFFINNRRRLLATLNTTAPVIITGNGQMQRTGDEPVKFNQDSNFWYLTGLNGADLVLVMYRGTEYVVVPERSFEREAFDGAHNPAAYAARSGVSDITNAKTGWDRLKSALQSEKAATVLLSPPSYLKRHGLYTLPYRRQLITKLRRIQPGLTLHDARPTLASMRCIKQPQELQALQQAIDITAQTLQEITAPGQLLSTAKAEYELEGAISYGFRRRGAEDHAFTPIVGAGKHTTTLHHMENNSAIAPGDLIVLDIGAGVEHYSADITRTYQPAPSRGAPPKFTKLLRPSRTMPSA